MLYFFKFSKKMLELHGQDTPCGRCAIVFCCLRIYNFSYIFVCFSSCVSVLYKIGSLYMLFYLSVSPMNTTFFTIFPTNTPHHAITMDRGFVKGVSVKSLLEPLYSDYRFALRQKSFFYMP